METSRETTTRMPLEEIDLQSDRRYKHIGYAIGIKLVVQNREKWWDIVVMTKTLRV